MFVLLLPLILIRDSMDIIYACLAHTSHAAETTKFAGMDAPCVRARRCSGCGILLLLIGDFLHVKPASCYYKLETFST